MSEHDKHITTIIENATLKISEKLKAEIEDALTRHTKQLKEYIYERDNWLADKIKKEMQEEVGKFKDKAVNESHEITVSYFKNLLNNDPRDDRQRKERQKMDAWVEQKMRIEEQNQITVRKAMLNSIFGKLGSAVWAVVLFMCFAALMWYREYGGFFSIGNPVVVGN